MILNYGQKTLCRMKRTKAPTIRFFTFLKKFSISMCDYSIKCIFSVCSPFTYGTECSEDCKCEKTKSEKCDAVTGNCHCQTGWTGNTCSQDVDECKEGTRTCNRSLHQVCVNNPGSSKCQCLYGGNNLTSCIRMYFFQHL